MVKTEISSKIGNEKITRNKNINQDGYVVDARELNESETNSIAAKISSINSSRINIGNMYYIEEIFEKKTEEMAVFHNWFGSDLTPVYSVTLRVPTLDRLYAFAVCILNNYEIRVGRVWFSTKTIEWGQ